MYLIVDAILVKDEGLKDVVGGGLRANSRDRSFWTTWFTLSNFDPFKLD